MTERKSRNDRYKTILARGFLQVPHSFIERFGLNRAVCLSNLINWSEKFADKNGGWFFQPIHRQMKTTGIGDNALRQYKKTFQSMGIIETKRMGRMEGMRINYDVLCDFIQSDAPMEVYRHGVKEPIWNHIGNAPMEVYRHGNIGKDGEIPIKSMVLAKNGEKSPYGTIYPNNKKLNNNNNNNNGISAAADNNYFSLDNSPKDNITQGMFDKFWQAYPKKADKGKALTAWKDICNKPPKDRPSWKTLRKAIHHQKKSERWQEGRFIPHPATWLNQSRWLDDPKEMRVYRNITEEVSLKPRENEENNELLDIIRQHLGNKMQPGMENQLRAALNKLRDHLKMSSFGVKTTIGDYATWLDDNPAVRYVSAKLFDPDNMFFVQFRQGPGQPLDDRPLTREEIDRKYLDPPEIKERAPIPKEKKDNCPFEHKFGIDFDDTNDCFDCGEEHPRIYQECRKYA